VNKITLGRYSGDTVISYRYDGQGHDLIMHLQQHGIISYNATRRGRTRVTNVVRTRSLSLAIPLDVIQTLAQTQRPHYGLEVALKSVRILFSSVGYTIGTPISSTYLKAIDSVDHPAIIGDIIETYALEISINWKQWLKHASSIYGDNLTEAIASPLRRITSSIDMSTLLRDFEVAVTHSLSHVLLNFHSIYTGGDKKDLNEILIVEQQGSTLRTTIWIFDTAAGGNGVSELLYHYLNQVVNDALETMLARHIRTRDPILRFLGEPGDVILGTWPPCPYGNTVLSRYWLLMFLAIYGGYTIDQLVNLYRSGQTIMISFP